MSDIVLDPIAKFIFMDGAQVRPIKRPSRGRDLLHQRTGRAAICGVYEPRRPVHATKLDPANDAGRRWLKLNSDDAKVWQTMTLEATPRTDRARCGRQAGEYET